MEPEAVAIEELAPADSPRLEGEKRAHILSLLESEAEFPPILVHRQTMRIIDGTHRVRAAILKGQDTIEAVFFDGSEEGAFVLAVRANVEHGLPLSLADRRHAATRIIASHPGWSDRMIAKISGLSAKTVRDLRSRETADESQLHSRLGQDGRLRPLTAAAGRALAAKMIASRPQASLREVARAAGVSPGTVRDVRERLSRGEDPVLPRCTGRKVHMSGESVTYHANPIGMKRRIDVRQMIQAFGKDPSLRMSESGRELVRWLFLHAVEECDCQRIVNAVPDHWVSVVAEFASGCSDRWARIAAELRKRTSN